MAIRGAAGDDPAAPRSGAHGGPIDADVECAESAEVLR
jgi:hypothetical protein